MSVFHYFLVFVFVFSTASADPGDPEEIQIKRKSSVTVEEPPSKKELARLEDSLVKLSPADMNRILRMLPTSCGELSKAIVPEQDIDVAAALAAFGFDLPVEYRFNWTESLCESCHIKLNYLKFTDQDLALKSAVGMDLLDVIQDSASARQVILYMDNTDTVLKDHENNTIDNLLRILHRSPKGARIASHIVQERIRGNLQLRIYYQSGKPLGILDTFNSDAVKKHIEYHRDGIHDSYAFVHAKNGRAVIGINNQQSQLEAVLSIVHEYIHLYSPLARKLDELGVPENLRFFILEMEAVRAEREILMELRAADIPLGLKVGERVRFEKIGGELGLIFTYTKKAVSNASMIEFLAKALYPVEATRIKYVPHSQQNTVDIIQYDDPNKASLKSFPNRDGFVEKLNALLDAQRVGGRENILIRSIYTNSPEEIQKVASDNEKKRMAIFSATNRAEAEIKGEAFSIYRNWNFLENLCEKDQACHLEMNDFSEGGPKERPGG